MNISINGKQYDVQPGKNLLQTAHELGIEIPALCDHPDLTTYSGCRLCVVEVKGARLPLPACSTQVTEGMEVQTETSKLIEQRRFLLELLLLNYYDAGYSSNHPNDFQKYCEQYNVSVEKHIRKEPRYPVDSDTNPFIWVDLNKCIMCTRCVRACAEVQGRFVWGIEMRGNDNHIVAGANETMLDARCESCGACAVYCPTGALDHKLFMQVGQAEKRVKTTCSFCGVGCQIDLLVKNDEVVAVEANPHSSVNGLSLCVKGRYGHDYIHHSDRLLKPQVRRYLLEGSAKSFEGSAWDWVETSWETAMQLTADRLRATRDTSGPDTIGVLTSAKCTNEENYLMNKLARQVIGTHNIDHCARL